MPRVITSSEAWMLITATPKFYTHVFQIFMKNLPHDYEVSESFDQDLANLLKARDEMIRVMKLDPVHTLETFGYKSLPNGKVESIAYNYIERGEK